MAVRPITAGPHLIFIDTGATRRGFGPACFDAVVCRRLDRPAHGVAVVRGETSHQPVRNREAAVTGPHLA